MTQEREIPAFTGIEKKENINAYFRRYYAKNKASILPRNRLNAARSNARAKQAKESRQEPAQ